MKVAVKTFNFSYDAGINFFARDSLDRVILGRNRIYLKKKNIYMTLFQEWTTTTAKRIPLKIILFSCFVS